MEAADDIAYCSSDIEDALEKQIITEKVFVYEVLEGELLGTIGEVKRVCESLGMSKFLDGIIDYQKWCRSYQTRPERGSKTPTIFSYQNGSEEIRSPNALFVSFKVAVTNALVKRATKVYLENHAAILAGEFQRTLLDLEREKILNFLRAFAKKYIFTSKEAMNVELSGYHIVQGILDGFSPLLRLRSEEFANLPSNSKFHLEKRLYSLLSNKQLHAYFEAKHESANLEPVLRAHLIVDYVSGMTDSHAVKTFNMLKGITT